MNDKNAERTSLKVAIETKPSSANSYVATVPLDHCYGYSEWAVGYLMNHILNVLMTTQPLMADFWCQYSCLL